MGADALAHVLRPLFTTFGPPPPDLLVGLGSADDAAVYRLNDEQAIVATTDFFPPVVDDAYTFGAIAAANALSDIYAMGGAPLFCLNLVAFPDTLDTSILTEILRGGAEKVREAGAVVAGGHSITDDEPKYGLAAIGLVHPQRILTKHGARPGDVLLLTKPIGTGLITTALKREAVAPTDLEAAVASMCALNADASRVARALGEAVHAGTDVTGFGLLGHTLEMTTAGGVGCALRLRDVPLLPGAPEYARLGFVPGGTARNTAHVAPSVTYAGAITDVERLLLSDPQTSGGLLLALDGAALDPAREAFAAAGVSCAVIGEFTQSAGIAVE
jgi:selenide,water dikinase